jgi:hypothetical protein
MIAAIVAPAGVRSIAMMRACLVAGRAADIDDAGVGRLRDLGLLEFGEAERWRPLPSIWAWSWDPMNHAPSAAPPQPRPGKLLGRAEPNGLPPEIKPKQTFGRSRCPDSGTRLKIRKGH